jgi:hypothetical protein
MHLLVKRNFDVIKMHGTAIKIKTLVTLKPRDVSYDLYSRQLLCVAQTVLCTFTSTKISLRLINHRAIIKGVWGSG